MSHLNLARYEQGRMAYREGYGVAHLVEAATEIDDRYDELNTAIGRASETPDAKVRERMGDEREALRTGEFGADAMPSLIAGFVDGFLTDFRVLVERPTSPPEPR